MMLFSSLSIVIVIVIVPRRLLWLSLGIEIHILLLLIIVHWIISHYLIDSKYAPHSGCQRGTCRCGAAAPVRRGEQRGGRWGNIDDWWMHGCLIVVVVRIIIFCRIQIVNYNHLWVRIVCYLHGQTDSFTLNCCDAYSPYFWLFIFQTILSFFDLT